MGENDLPPGTVATVSVSFLILVFAVFYFITGVDWAAVTLLLTPSAIAVAWTYIQTGKLTKNFETVHSDINA